jgi:hypothetical protein
VRPQPSRLAAAGHAERRISVLRGHQAFQLALDILHGAFDSPVGGLGCLMADQRSPVRLQLDPQIRLYAPLISMLPQHEHRGWFGSVLEPSLQATQVRAHPPLVDFRQREPLKVEPS